MRILFIPSQTRVGFGLLYNEATINDPRQVAPEGWRVAELNDVIDLIAYLGGDLVAGGKMKSLTAWTSPNTGATNESGLNALPAGQRNEAGQFTGQLVKTAFWFKNS